MGGTSHRWRARQEKWQEDLYEALSLLARVDRGARHWAIYHGPSVDQQALYDGRVNLAVAFQEGFALFWVEQAHDIRDVEQAIKKLVTRWKKVFHDPTIAFGAAGEV